MKFYYKKNGEGNERKYSPSIKHQKLQTTCSSVVDWWHQQNVGNKIKAFHKLEFTSTTVPFLPVWDFHFSAVKENIHHRLLFIYLAFFVVCCVWSTMTKLSGVVLELTDCYPFFVSDCSPKP